MTINYTIRFKIGTRDWIALYLVASKMFTGPTLNLCKVLRIFFYNFLDLMLHQLYSQLKQLQKPN